MTWIDIGNEIMLSVDNSDELGVNGNVNRLSQNDSQKSYFIFEKSSILYVNNLIFQT